MRNGRKETKRKREGHEGKKKQPLKGGGRCRTAMWKGLVCENPFTKRKGKKRDAQNEKKKNREKARETNQKVGGGHEFLPPKRRKEKVGMSEHMVERSKGEDHRQP